MGWSFKVHGGVAAGLGAVFLALAWLTRLPGALPLLDERWLLPLNFVVVFPTVTAALARLVLARTDKAQFWQASRCLPGKVQAGLAMLFLSGMAMMFLNMGREGNLQSAEVRDGKYFAFDTTARGTAELSWEQYQVVLEVDQRSMLTIPGVVLVGAACAVLAAGELRRADRGVAPSR
ncbi:hypothetical protein OH738_28105 [Streptomyces hirsutus]|uniref:Uncharacterized protein n=1 Tax=Streptomyces hirsutus TaxID=35620 RepID=A0ABZ1GJM5_9ACTN|nr:hypothetical protein [Streptomyces hirsutus]WSD06357.1 hypothetical protein OIE73_11600 [Streptomyces hirsutus]WTD20232.1 hypothetical protein OH738_28105 [Streptomyces hirsutus]